MGRLAHDYFGSLAGISREGGLHATVDCSRDWVHILFMGIVIPPPPPFVPPAATPQGRPELLVVAAQRPIAAQTTRAVTAASRGKEGNKAADPDHRGAEGES